ncbi:phage tail tape measure protein [Viridibacillus arvi]|uniref:phage tail tape measure protein n=1 Tax=Viridibacillus arvi TaxID=263475 RepID=UPI003D268D31
MADAEVGNLRVSLSMNSATFERSLASIDRSIKTLGQEMSIMRNRGREWGNTTDGLRTKQETLTRLLSSQEAKVRSLRTAYERSKQETGENSAATERLAAQLNRAVAEYTRTETEINDVTAALRRQEEELRRSQSNWQRAGESMQRVGETMQKVGDKMKAVGQSMSLYVSASITAMAGGAVKAAIDFESAFAGVRKTVNTSEEGFKKLETGIREMSKTLPTSASDIAAVAESAGQLGIAEESILGFTRTIIDLGESTNLTREQAASEFARFANIVGMSQKDFDKLGSSIVGLGNTMATTESEIMSMAMRLAAQGNQVGMTEDQILALSATMSSLGIEAEAGGTAMTTVLKKIDKAVGAGGKSLEGFANVAGMTSADFKNAFEKDAVGALDMFIKGLSKSSKNGENLTTILDGLGIKGIREADTLLRMAGASDLLSSAVKTSSDAWKENTALSNEAEQRYKTTASQLSMLKNKLTDVGITIGNILIPIMMQMVDKVTPIIEGFSKLSDGTQKFILAVGGIAAAIGPALIVIGTLIKSVGAITTALAPVATAIGEAGGLMEILGTAMAAIVSPIGIAVIAIAGVGTALVLAYNKIGWFRDGVNEIWEKIKGLTSAAFSVIKSTVKDAISGIVTFGKSLLDKFKGFWEENGQAISAMMKLYFDEIKSNIEMAMGIIKGVFEVVWPIITGVVKVAWGIISSTVKVATDLVLGIIQTVMKLIQGDWKGAWESIKDTSKNILDSIVNTFKNIDLKQVGKDIVQGFVTGFGTIKDSVSERLSNTKEAIVTKLSEWKTTISEWFSSLPDVITTKLTEWKTAITDWFTNTKENIATSLVDWGVTISSWFSSIPSLIMTQLTSWGTAIKNWAIEQNEENKRQFTDWGVAIATWFSKMPAEISNKLNEWKTTITDWFTTAKESISEKLTNWTTAITEWFTAMPGKISEKFSEWGTTISKWFTDTKENISTKLSDWGTSISKWFTDMPGKIRTSLDGWWTKMSTWFSEIPAKITAKFEEWWKAIKDWFSSVPEKPEIKNMGKNLIDKVSDGTKEKKPEFMDKLGKIIVDVAKGALMLAAVAVIATGREVIKRLIEGVTAMKTKLTDKAKELMDSFKSKIAEIDLMQVGKDVISGFVNGITKKINDVRVAAQNIGKAFLGSMDKALDRHSPSKETEKRGKDTGQGFVNGIAKKEKDIANAGKKAASTALKSFNQKMQKLDLKLSAGKINLKQYVSSLESMKTQYSGVANAIEKIDAKIAKTRESSSKKQLAALTKTFNNEMSKLSLNFKAKKIDTSEYIKSLESMKNSYKGVANANAKIDAQIATLRKNDIKEMFKDDKANYAAKKKDKEVSLTDELDYLKTVTKHYKKNTEERIYFENLAKQKKQEITAVKKKIDDDYLKNVQDLNQKLIDGENKLKEEYKKAVDDRAKSLYSFAGLFDEIAEKAEVSGQQLIANLQGQVDTFKNWSENIASLASKGIDEGLLAELQAMGPQAGAEIAALNTLSDEQLTQYTALWKEKSKLARDQAVGELEGMRIETAEKINQLNRDTKKQLKEYQAEWKASMKTVTRNTKSELSVMPDIGSYAVQGLIDGMLSRKAELERIAAELAAIVAGTAKEGVGMPTSSPKTKGIGIDINSGFVQGIQESTAKLKQALANTYNGMASTAQNMMGMTSVSNTHSTTELKTVNYNTYQMTYQSPKPLDPYEASRMTRNSLKELGLQL